MSTRHIPGYSGYVPGEKWRFGSIKREHAFVVEQHYSNDSVQMTRPPVEDVVPEVHIEKEDDIIDAEQQTNMHDLDNLHDQLDQVAAKNQSNNQNHPEPVGRSIQELDGRTINNHNPYVLFMPNNPFSDLPGDYNLDHNGQRRRFKGRFYEKPEIENEKRRKQAAPQEAHFSPASGYSGHIPGLATTVGKPFDQYVKERNALK